MENGLFPPEGVNVISWIFTPDLWGTVVLEADSFDQVMRAIGVWRAAVPGMFTTTKTAPAMAVQEIVSLAGKINHSVNG